MKLKERIQSPCPPFFKKLRNIGLALAATSAAILTAPVSLPLLLVKVAGYVAVAGGVATAVSQASCQKEEGGGDAH